MCTSVKLVCVGDSSCGKTSLLIAYTSEEFPSKYVPTVFDNYSANVMIDGVTISLGLWDTAGQEDYDRLRPLTYPQTDVCIILFSVTSFPSLQNVATKWQPEIQRFAPSAKIILATSNIDLRDDPEAVRRMQERGHRGCITTEEGRAMAKRIGAVRYMECSSKTQVGVRELFEEAIRVCVPELSRKKPGLFGSMRRLFHKDSSDATKKDPRYEANSNDNVDE